MQASKPTAGQLRHASHASSARHAAACLPARRRDVRMQHSPNPLPPMGLESAMVTDAAVPEGHKGLHATLYGEGGAEQHSSDGYDRRQEDDGSTLIPVDAYLAGRDKEKPLGVYAVHNQDRVLQYVGYSRNMVLAIKTLFKRLGPSRVAFVRTLVFTNNRTMATRQYMEQEVEKWIKQSEVTPPGNGPERHLWDPEGPNTQSIAGVQLSVDLSVMSEAERAEYEEKKFKMKKAMGDKSVEQEQEKQGEPSTEKRRSDMIKALNNGDWSQVIDGQTQETTAAAGGSAKAGGPKGSTAEGALVGPDLASPFTQDSVTKTMDEMDVRATLDELDLPLAECGEQVLMTVESVDKALDQVRPYLISDGGNVEVLNVANGIVLLRMEGACGTCSQSETTMQMGIEKTLRMAFGDQFKEVIEVPGGEEAPKVTAGTINTHLDQLRPALTALGGKVEVVDLKQGVCVIKYKGPPAMGQGISSAIRDTFRKDVKEVLVVGF